MGYAFCLGHCVACGRLFNFNPIRVPSVRVKGVKEPVCRSCMVVVNREREKNGLAPFEIHPEAYEACDESELG